MVSSGIVAHKDTIKSKADLVRRFMRAASRSLEEAAKNPEAAVDAMLKANPKAGFRDTLIVGMRQTAALYHTADTAKDVPFKVSARNMAETMALLTEYGGVDKAAGRVEQYYTNEFLP